MSADGDFLRFARRSASDIVKNADEDDIEAIVEIAEAIIEANNARLKWLY